MKYCRFCLPYYKQGDDLRNNLDNSNSIEEALELHAQQLEYAISLLRQLKAYANSIDIMADTHCISISCDEDTLNKLLNQGLVELEPECEECDEFMNECGCD